MGEYHSIRMARALDLTREGQTNGRESALRLYRPFPGDTYNLQIFSKGPIFDGGKDRFIVSTVEVTLADLEALLASARDNAYPFPIVPQEPPHPRLVVALGEENPCFTSNVPMDILVRDYEVVPNYGDPEDIHIDASGAEHYAYIVTVESGTCELDPEVVDNAFDRYLEEERTKEPEAMAPPDPIEEGLAIISRLSVAVNGYRLGGVWTNPDINGRIQWHATWVRRHKDQTYTTGPYASIRELIDTETAKLA
jgi:hypothetical protein